MLICVAKNMSLCHRWRTIRSAGVIRAAKHRATYTSSTSGSKNVKAADNHRGAAEIIKLF